MRGVVANGETGGSVDGAGDLNGDGIDDIVVGARAADPPGRQNAGVTYIVFGRDTADSGAFPALFELSDLLPENGGDGSQGFVLNGIGAESTSGSSVAGGDDVNNDGIADLLISAHLSDHVGQPDAGDVYLVYGRHTSQAGNFAPVIELSSLLPSNGGDGSAGVVLLGIDANDRAGTGLAGAGDVNGDGFSDILIGAQLADPMNRANAGESYVVFGR